MIRKGYELSDEEIVEEYSKITQAITMPPYYYPTVAGMLDHIGNFCDLLDVGCGNGYLLEKISTLHPDKELHGLEFCDGLVENTKMRLGSKANIAPGNAANMPFEDSRFDVVVFSEVLEHLKEPYASLCEAKRVLRRNGTLLVGIPSMSGYSPFRIIAERFSNHIIGRMFLPYEHPSKSIQPIDTAYTYGEIRDLLSQAGFKITKIRGGEYLPYLLHDIPYVSARVRGMNLQKVLDPLMNAFGLQRFAYRLFITCKPSGNYLG